MTIKLYDEDSHCRCFTARVLTCRKGKNETWLVTLDRTAFFPEGGGQPADRGTLGGGEVLDVQEWENDILHITSAPLVPGTEVIGALDWSLRFRRMQCHSGEHIISGLAHSLYGCTNVGFHLGEQEVILDFDKELSQKQISHLEELANEVITENRPVTAAYPDGDTLKTLDYRSKLALTENIRIVTIEGCDICACCAPHVNFTGEIGLVKILDAMRHRGGIRLWMAAGRMALEDYRTKQASAAAISAALSVPRDQIAQGVDRLKGELESLTLTLKETRQALVREKIKHISAASEHLCLFEEGLDTNELRTIANAGVEKCGGICAVFSGSDQEGYRYVMGSRTVDLRAEAGAINQALGGKGGGQSTMIQGSVTATRAVIEAYFQNGV